MEEHHHQEHQKTWYNKSYKLFFFIPVALLILSLIYLAHFNSVEGDIVKKDVTLKGGTIISVFDSHVDIKAVEAAMSQQFPDTIVRGSSDFRTGAQTGFTLQTEADVAQIKPALEKFLGYSLTQDNSSIEFSKAAISSGFYQQLRLAVLIAFVLMALAVFLVFRTFVPSAAVIFAAFADMVMTIAVVDMLGLYVSVAGIVSFLMLIGYSVDTDILLTSRVLRKREGTINERIFGAFKTGITMTLTAIAATLVAFFMIRSSSAVLEQMFTIILIGLFFDILNTWLTNASIIKWYAERKEKAQ